MGKEYWVDFHDFDNFFLPKINTKATIYSILPKIGSTTLLWRKFSSVLLKEVGNEGDYFEGM